MDNDRFNLEAISKKFIFCPHCGRPLELSSGQKKSHMYQCGTCSTRFDIDKSTPPKPYEVMIKQRPPLSFTFRPGKIVTCFSGGTGSLRKGYPAYWTIVQGVVVGFFSHEAEKLFTSPPVLEPSSDNLHFLHDLGFTPVKVGYEYVLRLDNGFTFWVHFSGRMANVYFSYQQDKGSTTFPIVWIETFEQLRILIHNCNKPFPDSTLAKPLGEPLAPDVLQKAYFFNYDNLRFNVVETGRYAYTKRATEIDQSLMPLWVDYHCVVELVDNRPVVSFSHHLGELNQVVLTGISELKAVWAVFYGGPLYVQNDFSYGK